MACDVEGDPGRYLGVIREAFRRHYRELSDVWTADRTMRGFPAFAHERLKLAPAARVLDVGCGSGQDVEYFAGLCGAVVGIDLHPHPDWAAIQARVPNTRFVCVDVLGHAWDAPYDLVFDNGCFHHQHPAHYRAYLGAIARMIEGGGAYVLSTFKNPETPHRVDAYGRLHRYFSDAELHAELAASGLEVFDELDVWKGRRDQHGEFYRLTFARRAPAA